MKCSEILEKLEDYSYSELGEVESAVVGAHLRVCLNCKAAYNQINKENLFFLNHSPELKVTNQMWQAVTLQLNQQEDQTTSIEDLREYTMYQPTFTILEYQPIWFNAFVKIKEAWFDFLHDPQGFILSLFYIDPLQTRRARYLRIGTMGALFLWLFGATFYLAVAYYKPAETPLAKEQLQKIVDLTTLQSPEIRAPKAAQRSGGGGGGGRNELTPPSKGRLPEATLRPQIVPPTTHPPRIETPSLPVAPTIQVQPELLPSQTMNIPIGDPKGIPAPPSDGSGSSGGIGTGKGTGVGSGKGTGLGAGEGFNSGGRGPSIGGGDAIYTTGEEGLKNPSILSKEKPKYTEEARREKIQGKIVLSVIFRKDGSITDIKVMRGLGYGLDEEAIKAATMIKFIPGEKDGKPVSVRARLEFTFNLL